MKYFYFLLYLLPLFASTQTIKGRIKDAVTKEDLPSVNVYYSGTSKGTISNLDGKFEIAFYDNSQSILTISLLGYESQKFSDPLNTDLTNIQLKPKVGDLPVVYINPDPWSREKKEKYFIQQFLGSTLIAKKCKIVNLEKVRMRFNPSTNKMIAYSEEPIIIENKDLNYLVSYDLRDFEIVFEPIGLDELNISVDFEMPTHRMITSSYVGSAFFKELDPKDARKRWVRRHRERAYKVSEIRLFKLISEEKLEKEGYHLVFNGKKVAVKDHIRSRKKRDVFVVDFRENKYQIMDAKGFQSMFQLKHPKLIISETGNVLNYEVLMLGGFISKLKVSGMLPLDYTLPN